MKKIATLAVLPVIALASCGKSQETIPQDTLTSTQTGETTPPQDVATEQTSSQEVLNTNISTGSTDTTGTQKKEFNLSYELPNGKPLEFSGEMEIENGKIKAINFPKYDLTNPQTYEVKFALKMQEDLIGKELKGLQYDGMSGASLTTNAFNQYLSTINQ